MLHQTLVTLGGLHDENHSVFKENKLFFSIGFRSGFPNSLFTFNRNARILEMNYILIGFKGEIFDEEVR